MMTELDIPADWQQSLARIKSHGWRKIMVIGAADRGKSSYCNFLAHGLQQTGARVAFVDGDIGQKADGDCLGLAIIKQFDWVSGNLSLFSPVARDAIRVVQFGDIYVDREGCELRRQRKGHF